jgi:hypothetical protein
VTKINGEFVVEKNIPLPSRKGNAKYPWATMEVGDSFLCPTKPANAHSLANSASKNGKKFTARTTADGCRVWRVE